MTTKHTPGPWHVERTTMGTYVLSGNFCVATTADSRTGNVPPATDNARLIAAAPDLLAALRVAERELAVAVEHCDAVSTAALVKVRAAIAKAEGV